MNAPTIAGRAGQLLTAAICLAFLLAVVLAPIVARFRQVRRNALDLYRQNYVP